MMKHVLITLLMLPLAACDESSPPEYSTHAADNSLQQGGPNPTNTAAGPGGPDTGPLFTYTNPTTASVGVDMPATRKDLNNMIGTD